MTSDEDQGASRAASFSDVTDRAAAGEPAPSVYGHGPARGIEVIVRDRPAGPVQTAPVTRRMRLLMVSQLFTAMALGFSASQISIAAAFVIPVATAVGSVLFFWLLVRHADASAQSKLQQLVSSGGTYWPKRGLFLGPLDDTTGIVGAGEFAAGRAYRKRGFAQCRLVLTDQAFVILSPAGRHANPVTCPLESLQRVVLFPAIEKRRMLTPYWSAWKAGRAVLSTREGKTATLDGFSPETLAKVLATLGANIVARHD